MTWIKIVGPEQAVGVLAEAYGWQSQRLGAPTEFTQLGSLYPELVLERLRLYKVVDGCPSGLSAEERNLAALAVSRLNETPHCASGARHKLAALGVEGEVVSRVDQDPAHPATGNARTDAILSYASKLTTSPGSVEQKDVDELRAVGLSDLDVLDLNNLVAYYNYVNRVSNGLGLRTENPYHEALSAVPS